MFHISEYLLGAVVSRYDDISLVVAGIEDIIIGIVLLACTFSGSTVNGRFLTHFYSSVLQEKFGALSGRFFCYRISPKAKEGNCRGNECEYSFHQSVFVL